jgi:LmbE family N-acetylglucosaminyl deacetylase
MPSWQSNGQNKQQKKGGKMKNVLVVAAHPDDEVLGVGGTIARHVENGDDVYALILGEGWTARDCNSVSLMKEKLKELRKNTMESSRIIGFKDVFFLNFPDNRFDQVDLLTIVKEVEKKIAELKPQIIYTHYSGDLNIDHQYTARAVMTATRPIGEQPVEEVYAFETVSCSEWNFDYSRQPSFSPNVFVDITDYYDKKEKALQCYKSEIYDFPFPRSLTGIDVLSKTRGMTAGMERAEAFMLVRALKR